MGIFPVLRPTSKWPDAQDSAGREIPTNGMLRSKKAWWVCGPPMRLFDEEIKPAIDALLRNIDDAHSDIDLRLYMIGRKKETSRPIIFVCCRNAAVRKTAEGCIRTSDLLQKYPGFGLGTSSLPLEGFIKVLHGEDEGDSPVIAVPAPEDHRDTSDLKVLALEREPTVGRKLWIRRSQDGSHLHTGTGGPVIVVGGKVYQLTSGHICYEYATQDEGEGDDDEAPDFDGKWDEEEDGDGEDPDSGRSPSGCETTSRGSRTPPELEEEGGSSPSSFLGLFDSTDMPPQRTEDGAVTEQRRVQRLEVEDEVASEGRLLAVGSIESAGQEKANCALDYALVSISDSDIKSPPNVTRLPKGLKQESASIAELAAPEMNEETRVVVVTSSRGPLFGTLIPTLAYFRPAGSSSFQKTQVMDMDHELQQGDSGSAVIDGGTGNWHGHIVRGCPGTRLAFLLPAVDIFENIHQISGSPATLLTEERNTLNMLPGTTIASIIFEKAGSPPGQDMHNPDNCQCTVEDIIATDESLLILLRHAPDEAATVKQHTCLLCQICWSIRSFLLSLLGEALRSTGPDVDQEKPLNARLPHVDRLLRAIRDWSQEAIEKGVEHSATVPGQEIIQTLSNIGNHIQKLSHGLSQRRTDVEPPEGQFGWPVLIEVTTTVQLLRIDKENGELMSALRRAFPSVSQSFLPVPALPIRPRYTPPGLGGGGEVGPRTLYPPDSDLVELDADERLLYMRYLRPALDGSKIPLSAKWTKIARELVSVHAVHETQQRYDARPDFIVVLGVLSAKQIFDLVRRTTEIKDARKLVHGPPAYGSTP